MSMLEKKKHVCIKPVQQKKKEVEKQVIRHPKISPYFQYTASGTVRYKIAILFITILSSCFIKLLNQLFDLPDDD